MRKTSVTLVTPRKSRILLRATGSIPMSEPVDYVCSPTIAGLRRPVRGSIKEPCSQCKTMLWIAPSTRKVSKAPAICLNCARQISLGELN